MMMDYGNTSGYAQRWWWRMCVFLFYLCDQLSVHVDMTPAATVRQKHGERLFFLKD